MEKILDDFIVKKNLDTILDKVAVERIPRFVTTTDDEGTKEIAVIVNAEWFRTMRDQAEMFMWLQAEPNFGKLRGMLQAAKGRAETYAGQLDKHASELAERACPRCREMLKAVVEQQTGENGSLRRRLEAAIPEVPAGVNRLLAVERGPGRVYTAGIDKPIGI